MNATPANARNGRLWSEHAERTFTIAAGVACTSSLFYLLAANDLRMTSVSGIWTALAVDFHHGVLYRPIESDLGYGGSRYFPLHFMLQGLLMRWTRPLPAGHLIAAASATLMAAAVFQLLRRSRVPVRLALASLGLLFVGDTVMHAVTEIKGDLLPLTLALWALVVIESMPGLILGPSLAGVLLGLAVVAKPTSIMYAAAICIYLLSFRRRLATAVVASFVIVFAGSMLVAIDAESAHSFALNMSEFGNAGAGISRLAKNCLPNFIHQAYGFADPALIVFLSAAVPAAPLLWRSGKPLLFWVFAAVLVGTIIIMGSPGTTRNHLIDLYVCSLLVVISTLGHVRLRLRTLGLVSATAAAIAGSIALVLHPLVGNARQTANSRREIISLLEREGAYEYANRVLCFDPLIDIEAKQSPYLLDSMMFGVYLKRHPDFATRFVEKLRAGTFSFIVLTIPYGATGQVNPRAVASQVGLDGARALAERYDLILRSGMYVVYERRLRMGPPQQFNW